VSAWLLLNLEVVAYDYLCWPPSSLKVTWTGGSLHFQMAILGCHLASEAAEAVFDRAWTRMICQGQVESDYQVRAACRQLYLGLLGLESLKEYLLAWACLAAAGCQAEVCRRKLARPEVCPLEFQELQEDSRPLGSARKAYFQGYLVFLPEEEGHLVVFYSLVVEGSWDGSAARLSAVVPADPVSCPWAVVVAYQVVVEASLHLRSVRAAFSSPSSDASDPGLLQCFSELCSY
jgi:hypothetical protein